VTVLCYSALARPCPTVLVGIWGMPVSGDLDKLAAFRGW
jgi:hypothetical protein